MKTTVLKCLLLDADVIIYLFKIGLWKAFMDRFDVFVSSTVANEVCFYRNSIGNQISIDLKGEYKSGKIKILDIDAEKAYNVVYSTINRDTGPELHMGEIESIALMMEKDYSNLILCTGDGGAIIAACLLGIKERIISLEEGMTRGGMKKNIKKQFTKRWMKKWKKQGEVNLIQGIGLHKEK